MLMRSMCVLAGGTYCVSEGNVCVNEEDVLC